MEIPETNFEKVIIKIRTFENLYYTYKSISYEQLLKIGKEQTKEFSISEEVNRWIDYSLHQLMGRDDVITDNPITDGLVFLPEEHKIINRRDIKETFFQLI